MNFFFSFEILFMNTLCILLINPYSKAVPGGCLWFISNYSWEPVSCSVPFYHSSLFFSISLVLVLEQQLRVVVYVSKVNMTQSGLKIICFSSCTPPAPEMTPCFSFVPACLPAHTRLECNRARRCRRPRLCVRHLVVVWLSCPGIGNSLLTLVTQPSRALSFLA